MLNRKRVIAGIIQKDTLFLLAQRGKKDAFYGLWEFPGGKAEEGETDQACLARELYEEFGIRALVSEHAYSVPFILNQQPYIIKAYFVRSFTGELVLTEHLQIKWVTLQELSNYSVPDPDKPIIAWLQQHYVVS